jgi:hypothetical protein
MKYGIFAPYGGIKEDAYKEDAYLWRFDTFADAKAAAAKLVENHKVEVMVVQILGSYRPLVVWNNEP